jgi:hypothetical protein
MEREFFVFSCRKHRSSIVRESAVSVGVVFAFEVGFGG